MKQIIFLIALVSFGSIFADVLPDGKKKISFNFEVTNTDSYSEYVFLAYPVNTSGGRPMIEYVAIKNLPVHIECRFGTPVIYAIKRELFDAEDLSTDGITNETEKDKKLAAYFNENKNLIRSVKVNCNNYVDKDEKYSSILRQYKITGIAADTMVINTEKILYKDNSGNVIEEKAPGEKGDIEKSDVVTPSKNSMSLLYLALPVVALIAIISVVLIRKMKKK
jgi:hypothetical protein